MADWFWLGLLTNGVFAALCAVGSIALAILKARGSKLAPPALYGLASFFLLWGVLIMIRINAVLPHEAITTANAEQHVISWVEKFGYSVRRESVDNAIFAATITSSTGRSLRVGQFKKLTGYILLRSDLTVAPEHRSMLATLTEEQRQRIIDHVFSDVSKARVVSNAAFDGTNSLVFLSLERRLPIDNTMTEATFIDALDEVESAVVIAKDAFISSLMTAGQGKPISQAINSKRDR